MEIRGPGGVDGPGPVTPVERRTGPAEPVRGPANPPVDEVQISELAHLKALLAKVPEVRQDKVDQVRAEIEAGTYETPAKIDETIERLLDELA